MGYGHIRWCPCNVRGIRWSPLDNHHRIDNRQRDFCKRQYHNVLRYKFIGRLKLEFISYQVHIRQHLRNRCLRHSNGNRVYIHSGMNQHRWHKYLEGHKYWTIQRTKMSYIHTWVIYYDLYYMTHFTWVILYNNLTYLITVDTSISMFDESFWTFTSVGTNGINTQILAFVLFSPEKRYF